MVDNVAITAGSGTTIATDDIGGVQVQRVKATWGPDGTANDADVATGKPLPVQLRSPTGTDLTGTAGTGSAAVLTVQGNASGTAVPVSLAANQSVNVAQINGVTALMGNGVTGTGSQRVTIASDNTAFSVNAVQSGTWNVTNISGTISLPTGATTAANQIAPQAPIAAATATATKSDLIGGQFDSTQKTLTNGQQAAYSMSARGALFVAVGADGFAVTNAGTFAVQAAQSGTWNIGSVTTLPALVAGTALIGKVGIDQTTPGTTNLVATTSQGFSAAVSLTRTADTNAYAAGDVVGAATGSTAALTFASMGPSAGRILITSASLEIDATAVISGETSYRLYLYNVTPPSALGDNAAWDLPSGDRASFLGYVDLGAPIDLGSTLYVEVNILNKQLLLSGTSLFGYLVTNTAYTPTSARVHKITLHAVSV